MALEAGDHVVDNALLSLPSGNSDPYLARLVSSFDGNRHIRVTLMERGRIRAASHVAPADAVPDWFQAVLEIPTQSRIDIVPRPGGGELLVTTDARNEIGEVWGQFRDGAAVLSLVQPPDAGPAVGGDGAHRCVPEKLARGL